MPKSDSTFLKKKKKKKKKNQIQLSNGCLCEEIGKKHIYSKGIMQIQYSPTRKGTKCKSVIYPRKVFVANLF